MSRARICANCRRAVPAGQQCECRKASERARKARHDTTRASATERGYDADWRAVRRQYLKAHPRCSHPDCTAAATEADHIISVADRPDLRLSWSNLRGFCKPHHSQRTARDQSFGMSAEARARTWPTGLRKSAIPLTIVCGPAGSGKSHWVKQQAKPGDIVIDLDEIKARLSGTSMYSAGSEWTGPALEERIRMLRALTIAPSCGANAFFIVSAPEPAERQWWQRMLGGIVHLMDTDEATCIARINADHRRVGHREAMIKRVSAWFAMAQGGESRFRQPSPTAPPLATKLFQKLGISTDDESEEKFYCG